MAGRQVEDRGKCDWKCVPIVAYNHLQTWDRGLDGWLHTRILVKAQGKYKMELLASNGRKIRLRTERTVGVGSNEERLQARLKERTQ